MCSVLFRSIGCHTRGLAGDCDRQCDWLRHHLPCSHGLAEALMEKVLRVVFLHGLGETSAVWDEVITHLDTDYQPHTIEVFTEADFVSGWDLATVTDRIASEISEPAHVVGLSLGAVIGLDLAIRHARLVESLFLSAPQARPSRALMHIQSILIRLLPARAICPDGVTKPQLLEVLDSVASIDFEPDLPKLTVPTTVVCGSRDRANQAAARHISQLIPQARHHLIDGVGHQWHTTMPDRFAQLLFTHISGN